MKVSRNCYDTFLFYTNFVKQSIGVLVEYLPLFSLWALFPQNSMRWRTYLDQSPPPSNDKRKTKEVASLTRLNHWPCPCLGLAV